MAHGKKTKNADGGNGKDAADPSDGGSSFDKARSRIRKWWEQLKADVPEGRAFFKLIEKTAKPISSGASVIWHIPVLGTFIVLLPLFWVGILLNRCGPVGRVLGAVLLWPIVVTIWCAQLAGWLLVAFFIWEFATEECFRAELAVFAHTIASFLAVGASAPIMIFLCNRGESMIQIQIFAWKLRHQATPDMHEGWITGVICLMFRGVFLILWVVSIGVLHEYGVIRLPDLH